MYFSIGPLRLDTVTRLQKLEDFQQRFMAYYSRKLFEPHDEFCECSNCTSNRRMFASQRAVPLDPEPQRFEKVLFVIQRGIAQASRMNATVVVKNEEYEFRLTADSNVDEEYAKYLEFAESQGGQSITVSMPNPWLNEKQK